MSQQLLGAKASLLGAAMVLIALATTGLEKVPTIPIIVPVIEYVMGFLLIILREYVKNGINEK